MPRVADLLRRAAHRNFVPDSGGRPTRTRLLTAVSLEAKEPRTRAHFRKGESYGYVRRARQKQKHDNRRSSGGNRRDLLPLYNEPVARNLRKHISTKIEFVIILKSTKTLGLDVPPKLLAHADEVIE